MSISLILANVRSICNKLGALKAFMDHCKPDILAVTESWGRPCLPDSLITTDGYVLFRSDRVATRSGGGVFMLVKESLSPSTEFVPENENIAVFQDSTWCGVSIPNGKTVLFGCLYRSPSSSDSNDALLDCLMNKVSDADFNYSVIVGDFQLPRHKLGYSVCLST